MERYKPSDTNAGVAAAAVHGFAATGNDLPDKQPPDIRTLRRAVAQAKLNRDDAVYGLRRAEARAINFALPIITAVAEGGVPVGDWKALGPNEEARKINTVLIQDDDPTCRDARGTLRDAEFALALAEAEIEAHRENRQREREAIWLQWITVVEDAPEPGAGPRG